MAALREGTVGILPAGALGVSLFYHLTGELERLDGGVTFIERRGSRSGEMMRGASALQIERRGKIESVPTARILKPDLLECDARGEVPEVILICPNPDQLLSVITTVVELLERIAGRGELRPHDIPLPILVLSSNGIYFQRVRQMFVEKLEEATLFGRLPDLWPELMPKIVGRLLRGITIQTGIRDGSGLETIYHPGRRGITRLAGGDQSVRERCCKLLAGRGAWFELAENSSPTRLEFDKAQVNLATNFLGQFYGIDDAGKFRALTVAEIVLPEHENEIRELTWRVFEVGRAVKAYRMDEDFETILQTVLATCRMHWEHVPSSLQWVGLLLRQGQLKPQLTPTESWILDPLIRYARSANLEETAGYFEMMRGKLIAKLALAIEARAGSSAGK